MIRLSVIALALFGALGCDAYCREYGTCYGQGQRPLGGGTGTTIPFASGGGVGCNTSRGFETEPPLVPSRNAPAITGGNMAAVGDGTWVIADADRAVIWHVSDTGVLAQVLLSVDDQPGRVLMAKDGTKTAFVVLRRANQIGTLNLVTHQLTRSSTCTEPRGLAWRGEDLLVGCATGTVEAIAPGGRRSVISQTSQLLDLRDLEVVNGRVLVSTFRNAQVFELVDQGPRILNNPVSVVAARGLDAVPRVAWRMRQGLLLAQNQQVSNLPPVKSPTGEPLTCSSTYGGGGPQGGFGGSGSGPALPGPMSSVLYRVGGDRVWPLAELTGAAVAVDMVETSDSVFVVSAGTNSLVRVDKNTHEVTNVRVPGQPTSIETSGELVAVFVREPAQLVVYGTSGELRKTMYFNAVSAFSTGHELFHRATQIGIACASCHPEAGDDGHLWAFAEGARRTPSLRGGIKGTEPFHWDGSETNMDVLLRDVMSNRMSGPGQTIERTNALTDWIDQQPALRTPPVKADAVERGRALFASSAVGCETCHSGVQGTNNTDADVGTGGRFQVPRLTEAFWRTPLLHDGSLPTLEARVFPSRPSSLHGRIDQLSFDERLDLLEYLKTR